MKRMFAGLYIALAAVFFNYSQVGAFSLVLNANQVIENNGGFWIDPGYTYQDDLLYATVIGTATGARYLRVGLEDPAIDTTNIRITGVTLYVRALSSKAKAKARVQPYFNGTAGTESPNINIGISEVLRSFNITAQRAWTWQVLKDLSVRLSPRTAANYSADHIFAVVTYADSTILGDYSFDISAIASPETLGYFFPVTIVARNSLGDTAKTYNGSATLSDSTGTVTPINAVFVSGVCNLSLMVAENTPNTAITVDDGDTFSVSSGFAVVSGLHQFFFSGIGSPQITGQAFSVSLAAADFNGDTLAGYSGKADLYDITGTLVQDSTGSFSSGVWNGSLTVSGGAGVYDTIWAAQTKASHTSRGKSNAFLLQDPLGVEFNGMAAEAGPNAVNVNWQTLSEHDCAFWRVERSSDQGSGYQMVGRVKGGGYTNETTNYSFRDQQVPQEGLYYYRIAEVSGTGEATYFGPVSAFWKVGIEASPDLLQFYPNPARPGRISMEFSSAEEGKASLRVYNITGALVRTLFDGTISTGKRRILWDGKDQAGNNTAPGVYLVKLTGKQTNIIRRLTILK